MPELNGNDFLTIFTTRLEYCRSLLDLSRRQMETISDDDYSALLELLGQKQRILDRLDALNHLHPRLWPDWHQHRDSFEGELRDACEDVLKTSEQVLAELVTAENDSSAVMTERRDATRQQLHEISEGTQAHKAYNENLVPATHRHLDIGQ